MPKVEEAVRCGSWRLVWVKSPADHEQVLETKTNARGTYYKVMRLVRPHTVRREVETEYEKAMKQLSTLNEEE